MAYRYEFDNEDLLVYVYVSGKDTYADHVERIEKITSDPRWRQTSSVLVDFSKTTEFEITNEELQSIAVEQQARDEEIGSGKNAVVAPGDRVLD